MMSNSLKLGALWSCGPAARGLSGAPARMMFPFALFGCVPPGGMSCIPPRPHDLFALLLVSDREIMSSISSGSYATGRSLLRIQGSSWCSERRICDSFSENAVERKETSTGQNWEPLWLTTVDTVENRGLDLKICEI